MYNEQHDRRLNIMKVKILREEHKNQKSPKSYKEMVEIIYDIIRDEAKKIHGGKRYAD